MAACLLGVNRWHKLYLKNTIFLEKS
jgi:hypothetical protein